VAAGRVDSGDQMRYKLVSVEASAISSACRHGADCTPAIAWKLLYSYGKLSA